MSEPQTSEKVAPTHRVIRMAYESGDLVHGDDGFLVFWPTKNTGAYTAWHLRLLADELDRRNASWQAQIEKDLSHD